MNTTFIEGTRRYISIDPGANGAVVIWNEWLDISDIRDLVYSDKVIDLVWVKELLTEVVPTDVIVENVHTSPRSGVVSAGNFMYSLGALHMGAISMGFNLHTISPQRWKRLTGLYGKDKAASVIKFQETFGMEPFMNYIFKKKNKIDRSEAALIGHAHFKMKAAGLVE